MINRKGKGDKKRRRLINVFSEREGKNKKETQHREKRLLLIVAALFRLGLGWDLNAIWGSSPTQSSSKADTFFPQFSRKQLLLLLPFCSLSVSRTAMVGDMCLLYKVFLFLNVIFGPSYC